MTLKIGNGYYRTDSLTRGDLYNIYNALCWCRRILSIAPLKKYQLNFDIDSAIGKLGSYIVYLYLDEQKYKTSDWTQSSINWDEL